MAHQQVIDQWQQIQRPLLQYNYQLIKNIVYEIKFGDIAVM